MLSEGLVFLHIISSLCLLYREAEHLMVLDRQYRSELNMYG